MALCLSLPAPPLVANEQDLELAGGSLWQMLEQLASRTGRSILFEVDAAALRAESRVPLQGRFDMQSALDALLENTRFGWRIDENGQVVVFEAKTLDVPLSRLDIAGRRESPSAERSSPRRSEPAAGSITRGRRLEGAEIAPLIRADFSRLGRRVPNVSGVGPQLAIRGVEQGLGLSSTVALSLDEMPLGAHYAQQGQLPMRLSRVDYLRGPRTSLDALGGLGGAIHVLSDEPAPAAGGEWRLRAAPQGGLGLGAYWAPGHGLSGHSWALSAAAVRRPEEVRNVDQAGPPSAVQGQIGARGIFEPDGWPELSLRWSALAHRGNPHRRSLLPPSGPDAPAFDPLDGESFDPFVHDEVLDFRSGQLRAEYLAGDALVWIDGAGFDSGLLDRRSPVQSANELLERLDLETFATVSVGAQKRWTEHWLSRVEWSQGRRRKQERERGRTLLAEFFPGSGTVLSDPGASRVLESGAQERLVEDAVLFAQRGQSAAWSWGVGVRGVRYRRDDRRRFRAFVDPTDCRLTTEGQSRPCSDDFPLVDAVSRTPSRESHWSPVVDLAWQPHPNTSLSLWWRRGLRPGGARADPGSGRLVPFRAERSESLDLHAELRFPAPSIELDATLFAVRWEDRQVRVDLPVAQSFLIANAGGARSRGAEIELRWLASDRLSFWVELGLLHTSFDRFPLPVVGGTVDLAGNRLPGAPRYTRGVGVAWAQDADWRWQANVWQVADSFSDAANTEVGRRPGYTVVDVYAERAINARWTVSASAINLLDRRYLEHVRVAGIQPRAREYWLGDRRTLQLEFVHRW